MLPIPVVHPTHDLVGLFAAEFELVVHVVPARMEFGGQPPGERAVAVQQQGGHVYL